MGYPNPQHLQFWLAHVDLYSSISNQHQACFQHRIAWVALMDDFQQKQEEHDCWFSLTSWRLFISLITSVSLELGAWSCNGSTPNFRVIFHGLHWKTPAQPFGTCSVESHEVSSCSIFLFNIWTKVTGKRPFKWFRAKKLNSISFCYPTQVMDSAAGWMKTSKLKCKPDKMELLWINGSLAQGSMVARDGHIWKSSHLFPFQFFFHPGISCSCNYQLPIKPHNVPVECHVS